MADVLNFESKNSPNRMTEAEVAKFVDHVAEDRARMEAVEAIRTVLSEWKATPTEQDIEAALSRLVEAKRIIERVPGIEPNSVFISGEDTLQLGFDLHSNLNGEGYDVIIQQYELGDAPVIEVYGVAAGPANSYIADLNVFDRTQVSALRQAADLITIAPVHLQHGWGVGKKPLPELGDAIHRHMEDFIASNPSCIRSGAVFCESKEIDGQGFTVDWPIKSAGPGVASVSQDFSISTISSDVLIETGPTVIRLDKPVEGLSIETGSLDAEFRRDIEKSYSDITAELTEYIQKCGYAVNSEMSDCMFIPAQHPDETQPVLASETLLAFVASGETGEQALKALKPEGRGFTRDEVLRIQNLERALDGIDRIDCVYIGPGTGDKYEGWNGPEDTVLHFVVDSDDGIHTVCAKAALDLAREDLGFNEGGLKWFHEPDDDFVYKPLEYNLDRFLSRNQVSDIASAYKKARDFNPATEVAQGQVMLSDDELLAEVAKRGLSVDRSEDQDLEPEEEVAADIGREPVEKPKLQRANIGGSPATVSPSQSHAIKH